MNLHKGIKSQKFVEIRDLLLYSLGEKRKIFDPKLATSFYLTEITLRKFFRKIISKPTLLKPSFSAESLWRTQKKVTIVDTIMLEA